MYIYLRLIFLSYLCTFQSISINTIVKIKLPIKSTYPNTPNPWHISWITWIKYLTEILITITNTNTITSFVLWQRVPFHKKWQYYHTPKNQIHHFTTYTIVTYTQTSSNPRYYQSHDIIPLITILDFSLHNPWKFKIISSIKLQLDRRHLYQIANAIPESPYDIPKHLWFQHRNFQQKIDETYWLLVATYG